MKTLFMLLACFWGIFPWASGQFPSRWDVLSRRTNTDGDIRISPRMNAGTNPLSEQQISFAETNRQLPNLSLRNVHFLDAKFDPKRDKVAVLVSDGRPYLRYQRYNFTNSNWQQELDVRLVRFDSTFESKGNVLELSQFDAVRATFLGRGENFSKDRPRGIEQKGDLEYFFRVTDAGVVLVNGQSIEVDQWWSPYKSEPLVLQLNEAIIARLKLVRAKLEPYRPSAAAERPPRTLDEAAQYLERVGNQRHESKARVEHDGVFYFINGVQSESDTNYASGYAIKQGDTAISMWRSASVPQ